MSGWEILKGYQIKQNYMLPVTGPSVENLTTSSYILTFQVQIADHIVFYLDVRRTHFSSELWTSRISNIDTTCWCGYLVGRFFLCCWRKEHPEAVSLLRIDTLWLTNHCKQDKSVEVLPLGASKVTTSEVTSRTDESFYFLKEGSKFAVCENTIAGTLYSKHPQVCSYIRVSQKFNVMQEHLMRRRVS